MHHFVYRITNHLNGRYYIGMHSTDDIEDGYMGSGYNIRRAIKEFGIKNFEREILHDLETRELARLKEAELVTSETIKDPKCYNLIAGGGAIPLSYTFFDQQWSYTFKPNWHGVKKWQEYTDKLTVATVQTDWIKLQAFLGKHTIEIWSMILNDLTTKFNRKSTHHKAKKLLRQLSAKNLLDCLYIHKVRRGENSDETMINPVYECLTLKI